MSDFSSSGVADLPQLTSNHLENPGGDARILGWLKESEQEGDAINQADPFYQRMAKGMAYVTGDQLSSDRDAQLKYLPKVVVNETRKAMMAHASTLTDLKPLYSYGTENSRWGLQSHLINKLTQAWWVTTMADMALSDVVKYAWAAGTGDMEIQWDPHAGLGGNSLLIARDPRDTLPLRPGNERAVQLWQGVTLRDERSITALREMWPSKEHLLVRSKETSLTKVKGRFRQIMHELTSPASSSIDTLAGLTVTSANRRVPSTGGVVLRRQFLHDETVNLTGRTLVMGTPGTVWAYTVQPKERVYPRGRLLTWVDGGVLSDGPSPFWHGMFPLARLKLWDLPWHFFGLPLLHDLMPVQDAINDTWHDFRVGVRKWMNPSVAYDRSSVSERFMKFYDPRNPGKKIALNATGGEAFKHIDGPHPQVLMIAKDAAETLTEKFRDLAGTKNIEELLTLRQSPAADTVQKYVEALTPEIRAEGRQIESFLREPAEMLKVNIFQFMSKARRIAILGDAGQTLEDFDYDPDSLVPAMTPGEDGYVKELDKSLPRDERAQFFHKQFIFKVEPNSLLAMNAQERKLMNLQLSRLGMLDFWTLMESLDITGVGTPPELPLPPHTIPPQEEVQANLRSAENPTGKYVIDPMTGQILEIRIPETITERILAQTQLGIAATVNPAGRKATGQAPPNMQQKTESGSGAPRPTVAETR
jgi:hypothetical protein